MAAPQSKDELTVTTMLEITREQRDVLWEDATTSLHDIDDIANTSDRANLDYHLQMRQRFATAMWLLDDLGWLREDPRDRFCLTMAPATLTRWLGELDAYAVESLREASEALADPAKEWGEYAQYLELTLDQCVADCHEDCDRHLERHSVCRELLARVA